MSRGLLPEPEGWASGSPARYSSTIDRWAWKTGRTPELRDHVLELLNDSANGAGFATPMTEALIRHGVVGLKTSASKIASLLTDLCGEGLVGIHLGNEWRITAAGRHSLTER